MSKQWYMTVGYPGGEFASQDSRKLSAELLLPPLAYDADVIEGMDREHDGSISYEWAIRPCPPDLAEWLDWPMWDVDNPDVGVRRRKVSVGWLMSWGGGKWEFIPVAGAAGITVLGGQHA